MEKGDQHVMSTRLRCFIDEADTVGAKLGKIGVDGV
jgi:hypothetical protein